MKGDVSEEMVVAKPKVHFQSGNLPNKYKTVKCIAAVTKQLRFEGPTFGIPVGNNLSG